MTNARPTTQSEYEAQSQESQDGEENPIEEIVHHQEEDSVEQVPQVQEENPIKETCHGDCKDRIPKTSQSVRNVEEEDSPPALPDRPANEEELQDRIADLKEKLNLKSLGDLE